MTYPLYDEKGSCEICSGSVVKRRVEQGEFQNHAQRHIDAGDPVVVRGENYFVEEEK